MDNTVIATGGSAVYSAKAMQHLKQIATIIYLQVELEEITARMTDIRTRGVVVKEGQTLQNLYNERKELYEKYADITINEKNKSLDSTVENILNVLE